MMTTVSPVGLDSPDPCPQRCASDGLNHHDDREVRQAVKRLHLVASLAAVLNLRSRTRPKFHAATTSRDITFTLPAAQTMMRTPQGCAGAQAYALAMCSAHPCPRLCNWVVQHQEEKEQPSSGAPKGTTACCFRKGIVPSRQQSYLVQHKANFDDVLHCLVPPDIPIEHVAGKLRVGLHIHQLRDQPALPQEVVLFDMPRQLAASKILRRSTQLLCSQNHEIPSTWATQA